ncbi:hypothetical protein DFH09DRAFT_1199792 [Mycena vulgaris]|nr:hypothetical protein DFH09DRAFT_1199792 [Mycena vulgaris]
MPFQPTVAQIRFTNIITCLNAVVTTLEVVSDGLKTPFLVPISNTIRSLLMDVPTVKRNKKDCTRMLEQIHELVYAIIHLHLKSETGGELPPHMLKNVRNFTQTLYKIHTFVEAQQEKSRLKQFLRQGEMSTLLKGCHTGLAQALEFFQVQGVDILRDVTKMRQDAQKTHQEVLDLIATLSDSGSSDGASSISSFFSTSQNRCVPELTIAD